jgi:hypothetical protein
MTNPGAPDVFRIYFLDGDMPILREELERTAQHHGAHNGQGVIRASRRRIHGPGKNNPTFTQPSLGTFIDAFDVKCECGMNESQHDEGCIEQGAHAIFNFT